jgi:hypothetical protein
MGDRARRRERDRELLARYPEGSEVPPGLRSKVAEARKRAAVRARRRVVPTEPRETR